MMEREKKRKKERGNSETIGHSLSTSSSIFSNKNEILALTTFFKKCSI
jgi:hypothetical protein